jgi:uncharacterized protein YecE (DUF72 family)
MKKLTDVETPLANFFASGPLALGAKLGPVLWQLPPTLGFDAGRMNDFLGRLPRTTTAAAQLAKQHDARLDDRAHTVTDADRPVRHAVEVRHPTFVTTEFIDLLRAQDVALVVADTAARFPFLDDVTADWVYVRLHGDEELYVSGYGEQALDEWAARISEHTLADPAPVRAEGRDVYVYFDNDVKTRAPYDAMALAARLHDHQATKSGESRRD